MWFYRYFVILNLLLLLTVYFCNAEGCLLSDEESLLKPGLKYIYHFKSEALGEAVGTTDDRSKISLNCDVSIRHAKECTFLFQFQNCILTAEGGSPGSEVPWIDQKSIEDLSRYPVSFVLTNGEITDIYTDPNDPIHFINIKRGALSAFVFKLSFTETSQQQVHTDIHGSCPLTITPTGVIKEDVKTSKDMLHCHYPSRPDWQFSPWSLFWNMSFIQYVINSTTDCDYKIDKGEKKINNVFCKERHAIMLESSHNTAVAVQTNIYYTMTFKDVSLQQEKINHPELTRKTSIVFEYERTQDNQFTAEDFLPKAQKMMADLVQDSAEEIRLFTIPQFTDFVAWLRTANDFVPLVDSIQSCSYLPNGDCSEDIQKLGMSYLRDGLVQCNTPSCFEAILYLAKQGDISPSFLNFVFYTWSNIHLSKPAIMKSVMELCKNTDSNLCWMSLATMIKRTHLKHPNEQVTQQAQEIAFYLRDAIEEACSANIENFEQLLRYLKSVGNMGNYFLTLVSDGEELLIGCASQIDVPDYVQAYALEVLKELEPCKKKNSCHQTYENILSFFTKTTESTLLRSAAYNILEDIGENLSFETEIINVLESDTNLQIKSYISHSVKNLLNDPSSHVHRKRFVQKLESLLTVKNISLERYINHPEAKSFIETQKKFAKLHFLPDEMQNFGFKSTFAKIYEIFDVFPREYKKESWWRAFSSYFPVFQTGIYSEGIEKIAILIQKAIRDINFYDSSTINNLMKVLPEVLKEFSQSKELFQNINFNQEVIANINKLENIFKNYRPDTKPFFAAYLDLFGSTLSHLSSGDFIAFGSKLIQLNKLMEELHRGVSYNTTHVIRVIEAYHQVPTMMGLPLNWTTNATLAFSMRSGLKLKMANEKMDIHSNAFIKPSVALTFLNRMVLDFPTITQIGVQANSSGFSSTHWKMNLEYSKEKKIFRIEKPSKPQKLLELFRTNQLIKHNDYLEIQDWDIERTSSSWCSQGATSSLFGVKACLDKSYPMVTNRLKPWALMSGWCKWQFSLEPTEVNVMSYDIELLKLPSDKFNGFALRAGVTGSNNNPELILTTQTDENKGETRIEVTIPALPDFEISLLTTINVDDGSYKSISTLKLEKDIQYQVIYNKEEKRKEQEDTLGDINQSSKSKNLVAFVRERLFSVSTPFNHYRIHKEDTKIGENVNTEIHMFYENFNEEQKWAQKIFSPALWENESKAWIRFQLNWKAPSYKNNTVLRQTSCFLKIPQSIIELSSHSLETTGRRQIHVNVTKVETATRKMLGFGNFTYDFCKSHQSSVGEKSISIVNLTIPRKSWSFLWQELEGESKYQYQVSLKRAAMTPTNSKMNDYVGWWSEEVKDDFSLNEHELKAVLDLDTSPENSESLVNKYHSTNEKETQDLKHDFVKVDLVVYYPFFTGPETLTFDGYLIFSNGEDTFRLQKDFDLESSYNNLRLTSHSVYRTENENSFLDHKSYLTHLPTDTKAYHIIKYRRHPNDIGCDEGILEHDVMSHVYNWRSRTSLTCHPGTHMRTLVIRLTTNSSMWDLLNNELDQRIEDINPDYTYETMNFTYPLGYINVTAEWIGQQNDHKKRAIHTCVVKDCQDIEFTMESLHDGKLSMNLNLLGDNRRSISFIKTVSSNIKNLKILLKYSDDKNEDSEAIEFSGEILKRDLHIWKAKINSETYSRVQKVIDGAQESVIRHLLRVSKDPKHPVNVILSPALKVTLYEYWQSLQDQRKSILTATWSSIKDTLQSLKVFYEIPSSLISNSFSFVFGYLITTYNGLKEKSVLIWAIDYFNVPYFIQKGIYNWDQGLKIASQVLKPEDNNTRFEFTTGAIMKLSSFKSWPVFETDIFKYFYPNDMEITPKQYSAKPGSKIAMIFGPLHVYTFDGYLFDTAKYSSDCLFLLAHDLRKSMFTVMASEKTLHVLFPEMSVTINADDEVFINGSITRSKLPIQAHNGKVVVQRSAVIEVWSPTLRIICRNEDFLCILELDALHSGGTFGLLGNADGSSKNDQMMPNGDITSSTLEFVRSFEVSGKSECKNLQLSTKSESESVHTYTCIDEFNKLCKQTKDVKKAFLHACQSDLNDGYGSCYAASGYAALGHLNNIYCVTNCNIKKHNHKQIGHKLEVVFIVQEHASFIVPEKKNSVFKGIERLLQAVEEKFKTSGYSSVHYSIVGFGGEGVHQQPTIHTTEKSIWLPMRTLTNNVLQTLEFSGVKMTDNLEALKYSLDNLGHDTFDSKVFIMLTAKDKQTKNKKLTELIRRQLENNEITLYSISSYPSIEKGKKVFGVRADGLIFPSPKKDGTAFMDYPRGDIAKLTAGTRGALFLSKFLIANTPASYFGEIAEEIWAKVHKEVNSCRECKVGPSGWWFAVNQCNMVNC